jgi:hypothetical protein
MNQKQLYSLLFAGIVGGGLGLLVHQRNASSWESAPASTATAKVLGDFPLNEVAKITVKTGTAQMTLARKDDLWTVADRGGYPADFARIRGVIQSLWELKTTQEVKVGPSQLARMELSAPAAGGEGSGTLVELFDKSEQNIGSLLLGKKHLRQADLGMPGMEGGFPVGRYVMPLSGPNRQKVSLVSEVLADLEPKPEAWLDKGFVRVEAIQSVTLSGTTPEQHWTLSRPTEEATEWKLADAKPGESVDAAKVPSFASLLGGPSFNDVLNDGFASGVETAVLTAQTFDGLTYTFRMGTPQGNDFPVAVTVTGEPPKERPAGKEEKPEEKSKLDAAFAAKAKALADRLAREKKLESRVFLISKGSWETLLKKRSDLLAEQKAEPSPTPAANPAPVVGSHSGPPVSKKQK